MPRWESDAASASDWNCGKRREPGNRRTSTRTSTACSSSNERNSSIVRVEWPIVQTIGASLERSAESERVLPERLEIRDQILFLCGGQPQRQESIVVIDDVGERRGASVVEIWRVLSEPAEGGGAIRLLRRARRIPRVHARFTRRVESAAVDIGVERSGVTCRAASYSIEDELAARGYGRVHRRLRRSEAELILTQRVELRRHEIGGLGDADPKARVAEGALRVH